MIAAAPPRLRPLIRAVRVLAAIALALAGLELASWAALRGMAWRTAERTLPGRPLSAYAGEPWAARFWEEQRAVLAPEAHPFGLIRTRPFAGQTIVVEATGLRRTPSADCATADRRTSWLFGGSTMWGFGSPDPLTIPALLAAAARERGEPACVVNRGEDSWRSSHGVVDLTLALRATARPPNTVVFLSGCNDVLTPLLLTQRADVEWEQQQTKPLVDAWIAGDRGSFGWLARTNTAAFARRLRARLGRSAVVRPEPAALARDVRAAYERDLAAVEALARGWGFRALFLWQPLALTGGKTLTAEEREGVRLQLGPSEDEARRAAQAALAEVARIDRPGFHDLSGVFDGEAGELYLDACHLTPQGNRILARRIGELLDPTAFGGEADSGGQSRSRTAREGSPN